jgi:tRNA pseudouridine38-40 synthase
MIIQHLDLQVVTPKVQLGQLNQSKSNLKKKKIEIQFKSQSFLQQQVRSMVGCLKFLGEKKWDLKTFNRVFKSKNRKLCAPPAPPEGLFLTKIIY